MLNVLGDKETQIKNWRFVAVLWKLHMRQCIFMVKLLDQSERWVISMLSHLPCKMPSRLSYILGDATEIPKFLATDKESPLVGIIMGSDSDLPVMAVGARILKQFGVPFELTIVSAHRTPHRMSEYAIEAPKRGLKCIIAGAGGAAHLPGMVAAMTPLPVIGVPVKGSTLDGVDSLHSIVQMPRGIPVATVAINNSTNAALLAIRILGAYDSKWLTEMNQYMLNMETEVLGKAETLEEIGYEDYLTDKLKNRKNIDINSILNK